MQCNALQSILVADTDKSGERLVMRMPEKGEVVGKRYKIQTRDRFGEWVDFGPFYFNIQENMAKYLDEYKKTLGKARIVEVVETVLKYIG